MFSHIKFCLEEIDCEIDAIANRDLAYVDRTMLLHHVGALRSLTTEIEARRAAATLTGAADDLGLIRGLDQEAIAILARCGIKHFADLAALSASDIAGLEAAGIAKASLSSGGWIEQAAILGTGKLTHHARVILEERGAAKPLADAPAPTKAANEPAEAQIDLPQPIKLVAPVAAPLRLIAPAPAPIRVRQPAPAKAVAKASLAPESTIIVKQTAEPRSTPAADADTAHAAAITAAVAEEHSRRRTRMRIAASLALLAGAMTALQFVEVPAFAGIAAIIGKL